MKHLLCILACSTLLVGCATSRLPSSPDAHLRPAYHFTPPKQWMNDPNGLVYHQGEYHLFYQFYPDSNVWGPMHWGHAVSPDMVHWQHLPIALYPDSLGYIFSGSAVVDWNNTSGFGKSGQPPLVAMFTYFDIQKERAKRPDHQSQAIAYSTDRGRTWTKYARNPVIPNPGSQRDFRDPKLLWHENSRKWVMTLAIGDHVEFWGSPDLKTWAQLSQFGGDLGAHGGVWECPDLFPMTVTASGASAKPEIKWVLLVSINPGHPNSGSGTQYFVGDFDGRNFVPDPAFAAEVPAGRGMWLDWGRDNYAGVTWSDVPKADGRRLFLGWMSNWDYAQQVPTYAWRSANTLPRQLLLRKGKVGYRLSAMPVRELEALRGKQQTWAPRLIDGSLDLNKSGIRPDRSEWSLEIGLGDSPKGEVGVELSNSSGEVYRIGYDATNKQYFSDRMRSGPLGFSEKFATQRHSAPRFSAEKTLRLRLYFDACSAELFADDGEV
ncbi:MAG TPA: glycoside hydrolase family 32 protein, partial [Saprospiraceae bacterium]|nr:glycoside hydrolase family 32 protein [Saprospiraceae bacterium]